MDSPNLNPLAVAVAIAGALLGPRWAPYVGAYGLILFGWLGGVLVGLYRKDAGTRVHVAAFLAVSLVVTIGATVPLAEIASDYVPKATLQTLLFPVAFLIPAIGMDWLRIGRWVVAKLGDVITRKAEGGAP
jgi:hypothetical protein